MVSFFQTKTLFMKKKQQILGAVNFIILRLVYDYPFAKYFEKTDPNILHRLYLWDMFKKEHWDTLKVSPKERFHDFNHANDFGNDKVNLSFFLVLTSIGSKKKQLLDFFTSIEEGFYFKPEVWGIVNPGIEACIKNQDSNLLFETNPYTSTIATSFETKAAIRDYILERFFENKNEGQQILALLERNIDIVSSRIFCFPNKEVSVYRYWSTQSLSFKFFVDDTEEIFRRNILHFYEVVCTETFGYQIEGLV